MAWGPSVVPLLLLNVSHGGNSTDFHLVESSPSTFLIGPSDTCFSTSRFSWSSKETTEDIDGACVNFHMDFFIIFH